MLHPLQKTIQLGEGLGSYVLRLGWEPTDTGKVIWVDYELIEVTALEGREGTPMYERAGAESNMDLTPDIEKAARAVEGFLKWDGCMQFTVAPVHVDDAIGLHKLLDAIKVARAHAIEAMGDAYDE